MYIYFIHYLSIYTVFSKRDARRSLTFCQHKCVLTSVQYTLFYLYIRIDIRLKNARADWALDQLEIDPFFFFGKNIFSTTQHIYGLFVDKQNWKNYACGDSYTVNGIFATNFCIQKWSTTYVRLHNCCF